MRLADLWRAWTDLHFPSRCVVCGGLLTDRSQVLCSDCVLDFPRNMSTWSAYNPLEERMRDKMPFGRVASLMHYAKGSPYSRILFSFKYEGRKDVARYMGRWMALSLAERGFFEGADCLVPIPLHPRRQRWRGYNQSEWLARGVADVTGLPLCTTAVVRTSYAESQTKRGGVMRWADKQGVFRVARPELLQGCTVVLIDDVLTTGATMCACAAEMFRIEGVRIHVLTLASV